jgi:hypothetical protein
MATVVGAAGRRVLHSTNMLRLHSTAPTHAARWHTLFSAAPQPPVSMKPPSGTLAMVGRAAGAASYSTAPPPSPPPPPPPSSSPQPPLQSLRLLGEPRGGHWFAGADLMHEQPRGGLLVSAIGETSLPLATLAEMPGARIVVVARGRRPSAPGARESGQSVVPTEVLLTQDESPLW